MTRTIARGRPVAPLMLSAQERAYLEWQVRRHRVARSLSILARARPETGYVDADRKMPIWRSHLQTGRAIRF